MNILIPDSWLREYLITNAKPKNIAEAVTLCGPTVDNLEKVNNDYIYHIEVTTNRVDAMSVYGIAREAAAILPQFGYKAKLKDLKPQTIRHKKPLDIKITNNPKLSQRILAIKLENVKLSPSPSWLQERLKKVGQRPLINAIDITNYVMWEIGHPMHAFDYDRITNKKIVVREAKKGETLITLDHKKVTLVGGEVVFDNGKGEIIDLPGIMGTANTVVSKNTKNILLWVEDIKATKIRHASMSHNLRSQAAILNEKHVDSELGLPAILKGVELFQKVAQAKIGSKLFDTYPVKPKAKTISVQKDFIDERLGVDISKSKMSKYLNSLGFKVGWNGNTLKAKIPTFRLHDIDINEDIVEEIARIYGYYKLPSKLMGTAIPEKPTDQPFDLENKSKLSLASLGGVEIYTLSLVPKDYVGKSSLRLKNPLGKDSEYLRGSLTQSLVQAANDNGSTKDPFHLFEMANVYLPRKGKLPEERMMLAGIFSDYEYREAKGIVESLLAQLNVSYKIAIKDKVGYQPNRRIEFTSNNKDFGQLGILEDNNYIYYEFDVNKLMALYNQVSTFKAIPKYPPQIEDITVKLPTRTKVQTVIDTMCQTDKTISLVELTKIYKDAFTFRVWYQHPTKTLTDKEVDIIRTKVIKVLEKKFGGITKA